MSVSAEGTDIDAWLSLVERCVRDAEVAGSNPVASTLGRGSRKSFKIKGFRRFSFIGKSMRIAPKSVIFRLVVKFVVKSCAFRGGGEKIAYAGRNLSQIGYLTSFYTDYRLPDMKQMPVKIDVRRLRIKVQTQPVSWNEDEKCNKNVNIFACETRSKRGIRRQRINEGYLTWDGSKSHSER